MMICKSVADFPWYPNGFTRQRVKAGDEKDFGASTSGLMQAGYIEPTAEFLSRFDEPAKQPGKSGKK